MPKQTKELRSLQAKDLQARVAELRKEMIKVNAQVATGTSPKNPYALRDSRRAIARILTIQRELRQAAAAKPAKAGMEAKKE